MNTVDPTAAAIFPSDHPEAVAPSVQAGDTERKLDTQSIVTWDIVERVRRMRFNPYRQLDAVYLGSALDMFMWGYMRQAQMLWQEMIARDFFLNGLVNKREKDCAHRPWHVLERAGLPKSSKSAAQEQVQILTEFWNSARCVNAYDRNETGGVQRLIKQMMRSVSTRWSVHHIQWQPRTDRIGALFERVPAYHFENRTGVLRFLPDTVGIETAPFDGANQAGAQVQAGDAFLAAVFLLEVDVVDDPVFVADHVLAVLAEVAQDDVLTQRADQIALLDVPVVEVQAHARLGFEHQAKRELP